MVNQCIIAIALFCPLFPMTGDYKCTRRSGKLLTYHSFTFPFFGLVYRFSAEAIHLENTRSDSSDLSSLFLTTIPMEWRMPVMSVISLLLKSIDNISIWLQSVIEMLLFQLMCQSLPSFHSIKITLKQYYRCIYATLLHINKVEELF